MEAIGLSGMDYVIIDKEHAPIAVETAADMIRAAEARDLTPFVRIKEISRSSVLKLLDLGAKGLIVPAVGGIEDVKSWWNTANIHLLETGAWLWRAGLTLA